MLKVLLVDDEPFILQGVKLLIDWEKEGFEITATAANGLEALEYLKDNQVDLIIADIRMPLVSGIELLQRIRIDKISDAYFVILSGYADFSYAQQAIRYECTEYILKPVEKESLLNVLREVAAMKHITETNNQKSKHMERAYLARNMIALIQGKYDKLNLDYVKNHMRLSGGTCYIEIELDDGSINEELTDEEKRVYQRKLFDACLEFLKEDSGHCVFDVSGHEKIYDIGFVYCDYLAEKKNLAKDEYLRSFLFFLRKEVCLPVVMLVGKKVPDISNLARTYGTTCILRSFQGFRERKDIYYYEEEVQVTNSGIVLCKKSLDKLIRAIEENNHIAIRKNVEFFYQEMKQMGYSKETMNLNINYLLFQLIHLATEQDNGVNQEEILRIISESTFEEGIIRGSKAHISRFACEFGEYLAQLGKNVSRGVLGDVEKEIYDHYAENLTLKGLGEKYFINSAYLGQLFRKKYGCSFKDYLNNYRMDQAAKMLVRTEHKIYRIAEEVGYHDLDYFVNRFIGAKGCTPSKYRKQAENKVG